MVRIPPSPPSFTHDRMRRMPCRSAVGAQESCPVIARASDGRPSETSPRLASLITGFPAYPTWPSCGFTPERRSNCWPNPCPHPHRHRQRTRGRLPLPLRPLFEIRHRSVRSSRRSCSTWFSMLAVPRRASSAARPSRETERGRVQLPGTRALHSQHAVFSVALPWAPSARRSAHRTLSPRATAIRRTIPRIP